MEEGGRGRPGGPRRLCLDSPASRRPRGSGAGPPPMCAAYAAAGRLCGGRGTLPPARACARPAPTAWRRLPVATLRSLSARGRSWGDARIRSEQGAWGPGRSLRLCWDPGPALLPLGTCWTTSWRIGVVLPPARPLQPRILRGERPTAVCSLERAFSTTGCQGKGPV